MNLLFVADYSYRENILMCVASIMRFPIKEGYDIYIMQSDWDILSKNELKSLVGEKGNVHFVDINIGDFKEFPETTRYPNIIYYRILAAKYLPKHVEKILYLDGDIIVINSLEELYNTEFDGNLFCACTHVKRFLTKLNQYRLGLKKEYPYINSGVLLMNLVELRKRINISEIISFVEKKEAVLLLPDQDIISALYGDSIKLIDTMKYNVSDRMVNFNNLNFMNEKIDIEWVRNNSVIIHYYGKNKPWKAGYIGVLDVFYNEMIDAG